MVSQVIPGRLKDDTIIWLFQVWNIFFTFFETEYRFDYVVVYDIAYGSWRGRFSGIEMVKKWQINRFFIYMSHVEYNPKINWEKNVFSAWRAQIVWSSVQSCMFFSNIQAQWINNIYSSSDKSFLPPRCTHTHIYIYTYIYIYIYIYI